MRLGGKVASSARHALVSCPTLTEPNRVSRWRGVLGAWKSFSAHSLSDAIRIYLNNGKMQTVTNITYAHITHLFSSCPIHVNVVIRK